MVAHFQRLLAEPEDIGAEDVGEVRRFLAVAGDITARHENRLVERDADALARLRGQNVVLASPISRCETTFAVRVRGREGQHVTLADLARLDAARDARRISS